MNNSKSYKIINKTGQSFQLIDQILKPRGTIIVKELNEQINSLERKKLIIIKAL